MSNVVNLGDFLPRDRDHITLGVEVLPVPLNQSRHVIVCLNRNRDMSEQRSFTSIGKALHYAAVLSAKHGCAIFPHGATADFLHKLLVEE